MPNIEEIPVAYPASRSGLVQRTGPSTENAPGERELFDHMNIWIPGHMFVDSGAHYSGVGQPVGSSSSVRWFPPDLDNQCFYSLRRPRKWDDGNITTRIWYRGDLADDALIIRAGTQVALYAESGEASTAYSTFFFDVTAPGNVSNTYIDRQAESDTTGKGYVVVNSEYDLINILFQRVGTSANDTYSFLSGSVTSGSFGLVAIELLYRPRLVESTGLAPWLMKE